VVRKAWGFIAGIRYEHISAAGALPVLDSIGAGLLRWGSNGIAMQGGASYSFDTSNAGKLFIFRTPLADPAPAVVAGNIVNAASGKAGAISPGEALSIYGTNLEGINGGLATGRGLQLDRAGHVGTAVAGVQVLFDSTPGTITYASPNQVNVIAPYAIARKASVNVLVTNFGIPSAPVSMNVAAASPAMFTLNGSGSGPGAILNQDGSLNSGANPAAAGSVVTLFGTGEGVTNPAGSDGNVTAGAPPGLAVPLTATIDGSAANVLYAGEAPGLVAGVFQMNIQVPAKTRAGAAIPVVAQSGSIASPAVTVAVK
jgi:uncharacterized protein (TIGR03437 family)